MVKLGDGEQFYGQSAIIVGASRGIGKAIAIALAQAGADVTIAARRNSSREFPGTLEQTVEQIRATGGTARAVLCDVADSSSVDALVADVVARTGRLDVLINSAVQISYSALLDITDEEWRRAFDVNVTGPFFLTRAAAPVMQGQGGGRIIHLTGSGARDVGVVKELTGASKAALERFVRGAAHELKPFNIAVNLFDPGGVRTERAEMLQGKDRDWTGFALPSEVAPAALRLAARGADTMTGQIYSYQDFREGR